MELFLMTLTTGILVGGIYALVALGWVLIYKCSGVLNLAMGELTLIGAYVTYAFYEAHVPFILAVFLTLLVGIVLGYLTERIFLDKLIGEPILSVIMVTVGLSFFFKGAIEFVFGTDTRVFTPSIFALKPINVGFLKVSPVYLWSFILSI
ncbi:MAG: branched-chain amino acid ABC transporter permease, partial [Deltaproteobacteria bacterium]